MTQGNEPSPLTAEKLQSLRRVPLSLRKSGPQDQKAHNLALVLQLLHTNGPMTRPQLCRATGLSAPAIATLVTELEAAGTVKDIGVDGASRVGKPASLVMLNARGAFVIAADGTRDGAFVGAVFDLSGTVVSRASVEFTDLPSSALDALLDLIDKLVASSPGPVLGIGVASHGLVDADGIVHVAHRFDWRELDLAGMIAAETGLPTVIGNDVNLIALGIRRFRKRSDRDLITVTIEHGVAGAVYINGEILLGEQYAAGELGHLKVSGSGEVCSCGSRGCLDTKVSVQYLRPRLEQLDPDEREQLLRKAGRTLGRVLAPIVNFLNVSEVAIIGSSDIVDGAFIDTLARTVRKRILPAMGADLIVDAYTDDLDLALLGATSEVLFQELGLR